jgi:hypothetical protein
MSLVQFVQVLATCEDSERGSTHSRCRSFVLGLVVERSCPWLCFNFHARMYWNHFALLLKRDSSILIIHIGWIIIIRFSNRLVLYWDHYIGLGVSFSAILVVHCLFDVGTVPMVCTPAGSSAIQHFLCPLGLWHWIGGRGSHHGSCWISTRVLPATVGRAGSSFLFCLFRLLTTYTMWLCSSFLVGVLHVFLQCYQQHLVYFGSYICITNNVSKL